jgi:molecular chaperone GrpE
MVDKRADAAAAYAKSPKPEVPVEAQGDVEAPVADGAAETQPQSQPQPQPETQDDGGHLVERDLDELAAKAQMADEYLVLAQRTQADFENFRKRAARDAALAQERGVAKLAKELLPAIDNLERALQAAGESDAQIIDGIKLVQTDLLAALGRVGIEPFSPVGEPFNPQYHEAVAQHQVEGTPPGTVVEVFQSGYRIGETVLRPARVLVSA